jgi:ParB/RepB/Spo0J family partition protein
MPPTAPTKPRAPKRKAKADAKPTIRRASAPMPAADFPAEQKQVPLKSIRPSPLNPRKHIDQEALAKLGDSMKLNGQMQECVVRPIESKTGKAEYYEIVAGERRFQAALMAHLETLRCRVQVLTDAQVVELAGVENYEREDLNPMEVAGWFQSMIEKAGYTQKSLAERLQISQPLVSQRLGLLALSEVWRDSIITGVIAATWTRHLTPWADFPEILQEAWEVYEAEGEHGPTNADDFGTLVASAIENVTRPLIHGYYDRQRDGFVDNHLTKKDRGRKDLRIVMMPARSSWQSSEQRCLNVELWDEINAQRLAAKKSREATKLAKEMGFEDSPEKPGKASTAEAKLKRAQRQKQQAKRLYEYKIRWLQSQAIGKLASASDDLIQRLVLHFTVQDRAGNRTRHFSKVCRDAGGGSRGGTAGYCDISGYRSISSIGKRDLRAISIDLLTVWLSGDPFGWSADFKPADIVALAGELDVDLVRDWRMDRAFLELHTKDDLDALAKEWGKDAASVCSEAAKRGAKLDALEKLTFLKAPKSLVQAKEPKR